MGSNKNRERRFAAGPPLSKQSIKTKFCLKCTYSQIIINIYKTYINMYSYIKKICIRK